MFGFVDVVSTDATMGGGLLRSSAFRDWGDDGLGESEGVAAASGEWVDDARLADVVAIAAAG